MKTLRFTVYSHTCLVTGKRYVGQTKKSMGKRWKQHVFDALHMKGCIVLGRAIRKHGQHCWAHDILEVFESREEANVAETKWIAHFDCIASHGYNLDTGGIAPRHPHVIEKIKATRAAHSPEWHETQAVLRRKAHAEWVASSTTEERGAAISAGWANLTFEERKEIARKREATITPEARRARARKGKASMSPAQRRAAALKGSTTLGAEKRREIARKGAQALTSEMRRANRAKQTAALTPEQRSDIAYRGAMSRQPEQRRAAGRAAYAVVGVKWRAMTHEQCSVRAHKAWATKRARAALEMDEQ